MTLPTALLAGLLTLQAGGSMPPGLREHVEAGLKARQEGDFDAAIRAFERVAALAPELAAAHVNLGAAYLDAKRYSKAAESLRRALELSPDLPGARGMLGTALLAQGYANEAVPHLESGGLHGLLGVALLEAGRTPEAIGAFETAIAAGPDDPDILYYLGRAHDQLAKQLFDKLLAAHASSARARQLVGEAQRAAGNREAAEREYRAALEVRPGLPGVHFALGELRLESGDYQEAEREFRAEYEMRPGDAQAAYRLGSVLLNLGDTAQAVAMLRRANELRPDMPETMFELARGLTLSGQLPEAETLLIRVLEMEADTRLAESASFQLANLLRQQGRIEEADRELARYRKIRAARARPAGPTRQ